jgi:hypothetical protein
MNVFSIPSIGFYLVLVNGPPVVKSADWCDHDGLSGSHGPGARTYPDIEILGQTKVLKTVGLWKTSDPGDKSPCADSINRYCLLEPMDACRMPGQGFHYIFFSFATAST